MIINNTGHPVKFSRGDHLNSAVDLIHGEQLGFEFEELAIRTNRASWNKDLSIFVSIPQAGFESPLRISVRRDAKVQFLSKDKSAVIMVEVEQSATKC